MLRIIPFYRGKSPVDGSRLAVPGHDRLQWRDNADEKWFTVAYIYYPPESAKDHINFIRYVETPQRLEMTKWVEAESGLKIGDKISTRPDPKKVQELLRQQGSPEAIEYDTVDDGSDDMD